MTIRQLILLLKIEQGSLDLDDLYKENLASLKNHGYIKQDYNDAWFVPVHIQTRIAAVLELL